MNKTITEVRVARDILEEKIVGLITNFEDTFDVNVIDICLSEIDTSTNGDHSHINQVDILLDL